MQAMMGIITGTKSEELLKEITLHRCMAAVPYGGRYRLIDFILSNMVNSGIRNVAVNTSHNYRALMDHLGSGKEWGLDRKSEGLVILPSASPSIFRRTLRFDLKDLYANFDYLEKSRQKYVVLSGNNMVCNINLKKVLDYHKNKGANITVVYKAEVLSYPDNGNSIFFELEEDGRISSVNNTPEWLGPSNTSMEILLMEREFLKELVRVALASGNWDLTEIIANNIGEVKVYGYPFDGYLGKINSVEDYYRHSMELLNPDISRELFSAVGPIYTKTKDGPPTRYARECDVKNSLVASGCIIDGAVDGSILFRGVSIGKGTYIKDSIIMQKSTIEDNVVLQNVILDKEVIIRQGTVLKGQEGQPIIIGKKNII